MPTNPDNEMKYGTRRSASALCDPLLAAATPVLFQDNAFRITGLPVDATTRQIRKRADRLRMTEELGQGESAPRAPFGLKPPPNVDRIREAIHKLNDPERRIVDEFFWFWPERLGQSEPDQAMQALFNGDSHRSLMEWEARSRQQANTVVAKHNLAIYWHLTVLDREAHVLSGSDKSTSSTEIEGYWRRAFGYWESLADDDLLWEKVSARVREMGDPRLTTGFVRRMRKTLPEALDQINAQLALRYAESGRMEVARFHVRFMRETNKGLDNVDRTSEMVLDPAGKRLKQQVQRARQRAEKNPKDAASAARELLEQARRSLALFDLFFGKDSNVRNELCDEVAALCNQLPVTYHQATGDDITCLDILKDALRLATSMELRQQIEKNIGTLSGNLAFKKLEPVYARLKAIQGSEAHPRHLLDRVRQEVISALPRPAISGGTAPLDLFDAVAIVLRGISLDAWNTHQDGTTAVKANELAIQYACGAELKQRLLNDKGVLSGIVALQGLQPSSNNWNCGCLVVLGIMGLIVAVGLFDSLPPLSPTSPRTAPATPYPSSHRRLPSDDTRSPKLDRDRQATKSQQPSPGSSYTNRALPSHPSDSPLSSDVARGTNEVPRSTRSELARDREAIATAKTQLQLLMNRVESLSREIERDTLFLDETSQFAVDAFNRKVKRCNLLIQQAKAEDRRVNQMVDDYNERLKHLDR